MTNIVEDEANFANQEISVKEDHRYNITAGPSVLRARLRSCASSTHTQTLTACGGDRDPRYARTIDETVAVLVSRDKATVNNTYKLFSLTDSSVKRRKSEKDGSTHNAPASGSYRSPLTSARNRDLNNKDHESSDTL